MCESEIPFSLGGKTHLSAEFIWGKSRVLFSKTKETYGKLKLKTKTKNSPGEEN